MNGYQQYSTNEGYSAQPPHPSHLQQHQQQQQQQQQRNMNTFAAAKPHPYNSYNMYDGSDYMYSASQQQQQQIRQGPPPELSGYLQHQQQQPQPQQQYRSSMNPNVPSFMPRQMENRIQQQQQSFSPFGYGNQQSHRPMQQQQQQPQQSQSPYRQGGATTNFLGYSQPPQQQQQPRSNGIDYATATGQYTPQQMPQRIPPPSMQQQQQQLPPQHQQGVDPLTGLRMSLAEQKQHDEEELKRQQRDQEEYASRFLAAVQERVSQPRPSSASAVSGQSNGVANGPMNGSSLQNLASTLQQEGLNGGYFDQDINTYDFEAQHNANPPFQLSQDLLDRIFGSPNKSILFEVQIGLERILAEPTEFEAWIVAIRDRLAQSAVTPDDLEVAAWLIIEMGIYAENAQYNFAKVCTYLYERLSSFKEPLLITVAEFHKYRQEYPLEISQQLLVFIAELYVQAFAPVGIRNHKIPTSLYEEFSDILKIEPMTDALIKKIVSTLKLCGRHLETDIGEDAMGELFKKLEGFCKEDQRPKTLSDNGANFITNLMAYRSSGWGGGNTDSSNGTSSAASSAPIRFAPDNMDLNDEEIRFLESNGVMEDTSYNSAPSSNDIYDAEILEDYEKFLRDHAEATAISAAEKALERMSMEEDDEFFDDNQQPHRPDNTTPTPSKSS